MNKLTLYELIKQKSLELGRPLKVVCDWDETLISFRPISLYKYLQEKTKLTSSLAEGHKFIDYEGDDEQQKKAIEGFHRLKEERKKS